jgi:hypothetical protein
MVVYSRTTATNSVPDGHGLYLRTSYVQFCRLLYTVVSSFLFFLATSIEAERQFSTGRRAMNFMQHNMSHDTFRARMALGSWDETPIFPEFETAVDILQEHISH